MLASTTVTSNELVPIAFRLHWNTRPASKEGCWCWSTEWIMMTARKRYAHLFFAIILTCQIGRNQVKLKFFHSFLNSFGSFWNFLTLYSSIHIHHSLHIKVKKIRELLSLQNNSHQQNKIVNYICFPRKPTTNQHVAALPFVSFHCLAVVILPSCRRLCPF